jgi:hypothetical protein
MDASARQRHEQALDARARDLDHAAASRMARSSIPRRPRRWASTAWFHGRVDALLIKAHLTHTHGHRPIH